MYGHLKLISYLCIHMLYVVPICVAVMTIAATGCCWFHVCAVCSYTGCSCTRCSYAAHVLDAHVPEQCSCTQKLICMS
jgi:hypothetical protein